MKLIGLKSVRAGLIVAAAALTVGPLMVSGGVASATPKSSSSITIGVSEMLTGASEYYGNAALTGVELGTAYLNAHGGILGHNVNLSVADDASEQRSRRSTMSAASPRTARYR